MLLGRYTTNQQINQLPLGQAIQSVFQAEEERERGEKKKKTPAKSSDRRRRTEGVVPHGKTDKGGKRREGGRWGSTGAERGGCRRRGGGVEM